MFCLPLNSRRYFRRLEQKVDRLMSSFEDLQAALASAGDKVTAVKTDVETLLAKLANIPPAGMTAEQQASLDAAVTTAQGIASSLGALDQEVNPPAPPAEPAPAPAA
jgi:hypothetical protein